MWSVNRISVNPIVALFLAFLFWTFSSELVFAQSCDVGHKEHARQGYNLPSLFFLYLIAHWE